jgi:hypothetical protein
MLLKKTCELSSIANQLTQISELITVTVKDLVRS